MINCKPQIDKPTLKIDLLDNENKVIASATFDKESIGKVSEYFKKSYDLKETNEVSLDQIQPSIFNHFVKFLNQDELPWIDFDETTLIDLYDLASQLDIVRLKALTVKEIDSRVETKKWQDMDLFKAYKEDQDMLGKLLT